MKLTHTTNLPFPQKSYALGSICNMHWTVHANESTHANVTNICSEKNMP